MLEQRDNIFEEIHNIQDILPEVADKKEIRFQEQPNGVVIGCYAFADKNTFTNNESLECRGIAFAKTGEIVSRPLHKFFNLGERADLTKESLLARKDIAAIYEKLDGSMLATAWVDNHLEWRSKKSFHSGVVELTKEFLENPEHRLLEEFAEKVASNHMTAIFELTHPNAQIVIPHKIPELRLLHVRDNFTGEYVLLNKNHPVNDWVLEHRVPLARRFTKLSLEEMLGSLDTMKDQEGYIVQFNNGDMVKIKCPWYLRLHRSITFLRERDIARLSLHEELDDIKSSLTEAGIDLTAVEAVESRLKSRLVSIMDEVDAVFSDGRDLDRKTFALTYKEHPLFSLLIGKYTGKDVPIADWYEKRHLNDEFSLMPLVSSVALDEAAELAENENNAGAHYSHSPF